MSNIAVCFLTYTPSLEHPRTKYAHQCLEALLKKLSYQEGNLLYHIADDGSPEEHVASLTRLCEKYDKLPTVSLSQRMGYGGNMNAATQIIHQIADMVLQVEEDWELVRPFDLSNLARAMEESNEINCVRLGYLGWTNPLRGQVIQSASQSFLLFDPDCEEVHVFAGHPRLEKVSFERSIGEWPEGIKAGWTEMEICKRQESRIGVTWPLDAEVNASQDYCRLFAHVGDVQSGQG